MPGGKKALKIPQIMAADEPCYIKRQISSSFERSKENERWAIPSLTLTLGSYMSLGLRETHIGQTPEKIDSFL